MSITGTDFTNGVADSGGAIYVSGLSQMNISSSTFTNNYAKKSGGAVYISNNLDVRVSSSTFKSNVAQSYGSDIYSLFSNYYLYIDSSYFYDTAPVTSTYCDTTQLSIISSLFSNNTGTSTYGGAVTCMSCGKIVIN